VAFLLFILVLIIMTEKRTFIDLFQDPSPALNVKFSSTSNEEPKQILVKNSIGSSAGWFGKRYLRSICKDPRLSDFFEFFSAHNGLELCRPVYPNNCSKTPLLTLVPAQYISAFTKQYIKNGEWAWIIDHNKSKSIYRGNDAWVAFAKTGDPNGIKLVKWPQYDSVARAYLNFTDAGPVAKEGLRRTICDVYIENQKRTTTR